jgi:hypothetical protein
LINPSRYGSFLTKGKSTMQQKELATLLDISPAMVSRLAKRGMPTDTLERAERWRRRHLEPGRVKGARIDQPARPKPERPAPPRPAAYVSDAQIEAAGDLADGALRRGDQFAADALILQLRELLPHCAPGASPRLTVRVWLALLVYLLHEDAAIRNAPDMGARLTPAECGELFHPWPWPAHVVIFEACDFDRHSINGWPDGEGDDAPD